MAEQSPEALLGSREWLDRQLAIQTIEKKQDASAVGSLSEVLRNDSNMYVRLAAARALGKIGDASAVQPLVDAFNNDDYDMVRQSAMWSLGEVAERDPKTTGNVLPVLQQAIQDERFLAERDLQITRLAKISMDRISKVIGADISQLAAVSGGSSGGGSSSARIIEVDITDEHRAKLQAAAQRRADIAPYVPEEESTDTAEADSGESGQPTTIEELLASIGSSSSASAEPDAIPQKIIEVDITAEHRAKLEAAGKRRTEATA